MCEFFATSENYNPFEIKEIYIFKNQAKFFLEYFYLLTFLIKKNIKKFRKSFSVYI
jgi:hypothetical protein